jgi:hypothetical protein
MLRTLAMTMIAIALTACVSTPNTKALVTPFGGAGFHTFAPAKDPDRMPPPDADGVARIAAIQQACDDDETCLRHQ